MRLDDFQALCQQLNPYCRHALEAAVYLCRERTHFEVTVDHFMAKLLDDPNCDIGLICRACQVDTGAWLHGINASIDRLKAGNTGPVHWTEDMIQLIERAWIALSSRAGTAQFRSSAILLGYIAIYESSATLNLPGSGVGEEATRIALSKLSKAGIVDQLATMIKGSSEGNLEPAEQGEAKARPGASAALDKFTVNLNGLAREGRLDRAVGRDREIRQVLDVLCRRRKNNAILVGEPGVGKTAIAEGLARRIVEGDVPDLLKDTDILSLDLGLLQAGAGVKGEFENRIKQILDAVKSSSTPIVLFIDEAHLLIGAGNQAGGGDAANLLKPALARGQLRSIAATTWAEYKKYFEKDAALQDRFEVVKIEEPSEELAAIMLRGTKDAYEQHHKVMVLDSGIEASVQLAGRYLTGRQLPRKAVDLLDTAAARVRIGLSGKPDVVEDLERRLENLEAEKRAKQRDHDSHLTDYSARLDELKGLTAQTLEDLERVKVLWTQEKEAIEKYLAVRDGGSDDKEKIKEAIECVRAVQRRRPLMPIHVDSSVVAQVIADWTGIPVDRMVEEELPKLLALEDRLRDRVRGQDHALKTLSESIRASKAGLGNPTAPMGVFLLVGPSGTGKTETALALAETLFGGERFIVTINMSEFKEEHAVSLLIGSPPGYVGYGEGGVLTEAVRQRPYSVVLLDEVEKAHPQILELFYQIFDKGYCEDRTGRYINFRNTIILMTSNLDSQRITEMCATEPRPQLEEIMAAIHPTLSQHFKPALLARFRVVPYYPLDGGILRQIAEMKLNKIARRLEEVHHAKMVCDDSVLDHLIDGCQTTELGARQIDHGLSQEVLPQIALELLKRIGTGEKPSRIRLQWDVTDGYTYVFE